MNSLRIVAAAALLIGSQAYADTIKPNTLTAKPGPTPRQIYFNLPLAGDTSKCILSQDSGETDKPGNVYGNTNGPIYINGLPNLGLVRTYTTDGTYTFSVKVVSGCTGGPEKVTFTIGNAAPAPKPALPALVEMNKLPLVGLSTAPAGGGALTPTKLTRVEVESQKVTAGQAFFVKQWGVGDPKNPMCGSLVKLKRIGGSNTAVGAGWSQKSEDLSAWPKTQVFVVSTPGTYEVQLGVYQPGAVACGYKGPGTVRGDLTRIEVWDGLVK